MWAGVDSGQADDQRHTPATPRTAGGNSTSSRTASRRADLRDLAPAMERWKATSGRPVAGLQWIGGPEDRPGRFAEARAGGDPAQAP